MNFQTVSTAEKLAPAPRPTIGGPVLSRRLPARARPRPGRCCAARWTTSTTSCSGWSTTIRRPGPPRLDGDHPHRQARPVAAGPEPADGGSRTGRSSTRSTPRGPPRTRRLEPDRRRHRRRPVAELPVGHARRPRRTSSRTTCGPTPRPGVTYSGATGRFTHSGLAQIYAGRGGGRVLRCARPLTRATPTCSVASRSASSTPADQDRRARRRQPGRPRRPDRGVRAGHGAGPGLAQSVETTQVAPTILQPARARPACAEGGPDRGHARAARDSLKPGNGAPSGEMAPRSRFETAEAHNLPTPTAWKGVVRRGTSQDTWAYDPPENRLY